MLTDYLKQLNELNETYSLNLKESFEIHSKLNNKLFDTTDGIMLPEIRQRLIEIADLFVESMKDNNIPIKVYDYWLVGSNAAYNYNKDSDIDIHIIVDMDIVQEPYLLRLLYDYIKSSFSQKYDIMVKGHEVELYLEDIKTTAITNGIYSLKQDKWIKFPKAEEPRLIEIEETPLFVQWLDRYEHLEDEECEQFLDDLYVMRKISLANEGEFGDGNLIFKEFRNRGYLDDLKDRKYKFESDRLTLESLNEGSSGQTTAKTILFNAATDLKGEDPATYSLHHLDNDHTNHTFDNVIILPNGKHISLHSAFKNGLKDKATGILQTGYRITEFSVSKIDQVTAEALYDRYASDYQSNNIS